MLQKLRGCRKISDLISERRVSEWIPADGVSLALSFDFLHASILFQTFKLISTHWEEKHIFQEWWWILQKNPKHPLAEDVANVVAQQ